MLHQLERPTRIEGQVDHFPEVLKHFDDRRLIEATERYIRLAISGPKATWDNSAERARMCKAECERRQVYVYRRLRAS